MGGIGRATVEVFAEAGWNVAATSRSIDKEQFSSQPNVHAYELDVTDQQSIEAAFENALQDFGTIDVVVNNAGYGLCGAFETLSNEQIRQQFETNVFGLMNVTRAAVSHMRPKGSGKIIQIASMGGRLTFPLYSIYHASKWAVEGFSESLQYELRQFGIQIKIIEPGVIKTAFYNTKKPDVWPGDSLGYENFVDAVMAANQQASNNGRPPSQVARTILKAATSQSSKMRFVVGSPAPLLLAMRKILPERLFNYLIRSGYRI